MKELERVVNLAARICCPALLLGLALMVIGQGAQAGDADAPARGFIVKLKAQPPGQGSSGRATAQALRDRVAAMAVRSRVSYLESRPSALDRTHLLNYHRWMTGAEARETAARMRADPDVEWVVPNYLKRRMSVPVNLPPSDPYYDNASNDPNHQWWLHGRTHTNGFGLSSPQPAAPDIEGAWTELRNHRSLHAPVVVAVLDSGVRFDHPDLAGQTLPGFDFVSDYVYAGDGNGLDADASDPGTYVSAQDKARYPDRFNIPNEAPCDTQSSWHGTLVTGMLAAITDNNKGTAGMLWPLQEANANQPVLLPVRVAGKCGATDSDIIEGMYWAAGINYSGSPAINPHPARVISLSYGGVNACNASYQEVVNKLSSIGVLLVAAAGNGDQIVNGVVVGATTATEPANCDGVLAVTALRRDGSKAAYANLIATGSNKFGIATVGGDSGGSVYEPIWSTSNSGLEGPDAYGVAGFYDWVEGTSFATPIAAGAAAMMLAVQPDLTTAQLITGLTASATPFTGGSSCTVSQTGNCICSTSTCGSGMLDALAAVVWAETHSGNLGLGGATTVAAGNTSSAWTPSRGPNGPSSGGGATQPLWLLGLFAAVTVLAASRRSAKLICPRA